VTGALEITPQRYGFLRLHGFESHPDDVYVSASQVRRCELRSGDDVSGPARSPRRGERHRALVHVDRVNGSEPLAADRPEFEQLTPILAKRRLVLDNEPSDVLTRAVDLLVPLALGQRVLVMAAPRSGRTTLLRGLARAIGTLEGPELIVLLIDERPEEATAWRQALPDAAIATATADLAPAEQVRVAELALERARRRAEAGADVVLIVDSLSRLAVASGEAAEVKRLFGSGRDLAEEGTGSLTVIATVVAGAEDDDAAERAVMTTESSLIRLDTELAAAGVVPALRGASAASPTRRSFASPRSWRRCGDFALCSLIWIRSRQQPSFASGSIAPGPTPSCWQPSSAGKRGEPRRARGRARSGRRRAPAGHSRRRACRGRRRCPAHPL